ncbi:MAG: alanine--tRNA ligase, partial [Thermoplasmata archaeon]|nr:alanine--tRNA ligase [Thermoplasmata archaeon]
MFEEEYQLDFFQERGFVRRVCSKCGSGFWTLDPGRDTCGDTPCDEYDFIGSPHTSRRFSVDEMRSLFLSFFQERGHGLVERYPVIARWRNDVLLVNASIYDFQPHVTSGAVPPPANPLTISQPCIRMTDLDSVGRTGKHISSFEMMAHHVFNDPSNPIYWKDRTVELCHELLTAHMGVEERRIVYKEHPWIGGGNAGPSLEVIVGGLEVATLVFMNLKRDPEGGVMLDGDRYSPLALNVVDTGYGLERLAWMSQGTPTIYETVFPGLLEEFLDSVSLGVDLGDERISRILSEHAVLAGMMDISEGKRLDELREAASRRLRDKGIDISPGELASLLEPVESFYAVVDHTKTIALMLTDGIVPSNVKAGYLARLLIRRTLRFLEEMKAEVSLADLVERQIRYWSSIMDQSSIGVVREMLELEEERYRNTVEKGRGIVSRLLKKGAVSVDDLVELYDSHGLHPSVVKAVAGEMGVVVEVPDDFNSRLAARHQRREVEEEEAVEGEELSGLPATRKLYYEDEEGGTRGEGVVLRSTPAGPAGSTGDGGGEVVLDATPFYPDGGGQPGDRGVMRWDGGEARVVDVRSRGDVIVHTVEGPLPPEGTRVSCQVDEERRMGHARHHTATHIL